MGNAWPDGGGLLQKRQLYHRPPMASDPHPSDKIILVFHTPIVPHTYCTYNFPGQVGGMLQADWVSGGLLPHRTQPCILGRHWGQSWDNGDHIFHAKDLGAQARSKKWHGGCMGWWGASGLQDRIAGDRAGRRWCIPCSPCSTFVTKCSPPDTLTYSPPPLTSTFLAYQCSGVRTLYPPFLCISLDLPSDTPPSSTPKNQ